MRVLSCYRTRQSSMLLLLLLLLTPSLLIVVVWGAIPEDIYAFPKYRVAFLNGLPVSNETAQKWLTDGLQGGELEFLDQWQQPVPRKEIGSQSSESQAEITEPASYIPDQDPEYQPPRLEQMRLGPSKSYLCLIPPAPSLPPPVSDDAQASVTPSHSWSLLQPLSGTCLYHRQAWFTYSYCHNLLVRQFRELPATYSHPPGARVIEEDPEWEAYTLGKSPTAQLSVDGRLAANDELALATNLELAHQGAGQRYLVQRWGDGTPCDRTGRPREIEIQFHCSMTMTDTILFVKETRTCEYVLVIHTPRLCGEPGFKSRHDQIPELAIRCRHILDQGVEPSPHPTDSLAESIYPHRSGGQSRWKPVPPPSSPSPPSPQEDKEKAADVTTGKERNTIDAAEERLKLLQKAIQQILGKSTGGENAAMFELREGDEEGEYYIAWDSERGDGKEEKTLEGETVESKRGTGKTLEEALRAAGYDIFGERKTQGKESANEEKKKKAKKESSKEAVLRDEL